LRHSGNYYPFTDKTARLSSCGFAAPDGVRELTMARWDMPRPAFVLAGKMRRSSANFT
jgi:hypothetical protein